MSDLESLRGLIREVEETLALRESLKIKGPLLQMRIISLWNLSLEDRDHQKEAEENDRGHTFLLLYDEFREILAPMMQELAEMNVSLRSGEDVRPPVDREVSGRLIVLEEEDEGDEFHQSVSAWKARITSGKSLVTRGDYDEPDMGGDPTLDLTVSVSYSGRSSEWIREVEQSEEMIQIWTTGDLPFSNVSELEMDEAAMIAARATANEIDVLIRTIADKPRV